MIFQIQLFCPLNCFTSSYSHFFFFFWDNIEQGSSFGRVRLNNVAYSCGCKHLPSWIFLFCDSSCGTYSLRNVFFLDDGIKTFPFFSELRFQICLNQLSHIIDKEFAFKSIQLCHLQKFLDFISNRCLYFTVGSITFWGFLVTNFLFVD